MALISLEGMRFHAYHGVYDAEKTLGNEYVVDIVVNTNTDKAAKDDKVELTMNYETIYQICRLEMETPRKLIETVAAGIVKRMKFQFSEMQALRYASPNSIRPSAGVFSRPGYRKNTILSGNARAAKKSLSATTMIAGNGFPTSTLRRKKRWNGNSAENASATTA
ncbi:MAG: dihydroneopterin aldolase [Lewinellaceae bacterium]|nr:dihydroneopterin aldolase [Lewinellaceae bacterium]